MTVLFADVSEWQVPVDDSYPHPWLSIRSNDGTYRDRNFAANYEWARRALDTGRLRGLIVYFVARDADSVWTHLDMLGEDRPDVVSMVDAESWNGQITGDQSDMFNRNVWAAGDWHGPHIEGRPRRVIGYYNPNADPGLWPVRPPIGFIVPSYGSFPYFPPGYEDMQRQLIAHQFTDGTYGCDDVTLPCGAPPFGRCDMNAANGYDAEALRTATGIGVP